MGLLTLMADGGDVDPLLPGFDRVDFPRPVRPVGDEQSRGGGPVHYSSHIRRLNEILSGADRVRWCCSTSRLGTDPREGGDRPRLLETLADREVRVVATTHFEELKDRSRIPGSRTLDGVRRSTFATYGSPWESPAARWGWRSRGPSSFPEEGSARARGYLSGPARTFRR